MNSDNSNTIIKTPTLYLLPFFTWNVYTGESEN